MAAIYSTQIVSWQGIGAGDTVTVSLLAASPGTTVRIDTIVFYWGNAFSAESVSAVVTSLISSSGVPTIATSNPMVALPATPHMDVVEYRLCLPYITFTGSSVPILSVVNTSTGTNAVDVTISGVALTGPEQAARFGASI